MILPFTRASWRRVALKCVAAERASKCQALAYGMLNRLLISHFRAAGVAIRLMGFVRRTTRLLVSLALAQEYCPLLGPT